VQALRPVAEPVPARQDRGVSKRRGEVELRRIRRRIVSRREVIGRALFVWLVPMLLVLGLSVLLAGRT
jgi:hypothetical protein